VAEGEAEASAGEAVAGAVKEAAEEAGGSEGVDWAARAEEGSEGLG